MSYIVTLIPADLLIAGNIGAMRYAQDAKVAKDKYGANSLLNGWQLCNGGVVAEYAVAKHYGLFYNGNIGDFIAADAGILQVRSTIYKNGCLLLHESDKDEEVFLLVIQQTLLQFNIVGWCYGHEGKIKENWKEKVKGRPCYFVEQKDLRDMETLNIKETK